MTQALAKHLILQSPTDITSKKVWDDLDFDYMSAAPPFRFRRSREVNATALAWLDDLFAGDVASHWQQRNSIQSVRRLLENIWKPGDNVARDSISTAALNHIKNYPHPEGTPQDSPDWIPPLFCPNPDGSVEAVGAGAVIAFATPSVSSGTPQPKERLYFLLKEEDGTEQLRAESFDDDPRRYNDAWNDRVFSVKRVYPEGKAQVSRQEFIDLSVGAILQRYPFLAAQRDVNKKLSGKLEGLLDNEASYGRMKALFDELETLNVERSRLKRSTSSLIGFAATKGYELLDAPRKFTPTKRGEKQTEREFHPGDLIQTKRFVTNWVEEHLIHRSRRRFLRSTKRWTEIKRLHRSAVDKDVRKIESKDAMVSDRIDDQYHDKNVVILQSVAGGLEAEDGRSLSSILERCEMDPIYQKNCVLFMPVYRQSLFGEDIVAGYHVIEAPKRGRRIVGMPEFYMEEQISYKLRWLGMELGELLSSINLLPGEVRDISIKTTRSSLREEEIKSSQNFETESSSSFDTMSSVENEFQKENTSEKTRSWSVKASGSYGAFSAGGSASGTSKQTARQFAKSLNKMTTQAISKMRKSSRREIVSRELNREELESVATSTGQVSNPNAGRTLNVNYFAVNNVFASAVYLDDIAFSYISPFELIDGSDIREVMTFSKEDLPEFLETIQRDMARMIEMGLEFDTSLADDGVWPTRAKLQAQSFETAAEFVKRFEADLINTFLDYSKTDTKEEETIGNEPVAAFMVNEAATALRAVDPKKDANLDVMISNLVATGHPIEPNLVISPSAAVYADSAIGATEGLESYAVDMRKLEVEKQLAGIVKSLAEQEKSSPTSVQTHHNVAHQKTSKQEITIQVGGTIKEGEWRYRIGATEVGTVKITTGVTSYVLPLPKDGPSDAMINALTGSLVRYV
jgi:hypothetical protein